MFATALIIGIIIGAIGIVFIQVFFRYALSQNSGEEDLTQASVKNIKKNV